MADQQNTIEARHTATDLKVGDLQPNDESLEMMHRMGVKPEDLKDAKIAKKYREWLAASALKK